MKSNFLIINSKS